jgi:hypothetical protein
MAAFVKLSGRTVCAGALILVLLCLAWKAGREGISNFYAHSATREYDLWATPGHRFRGDEWVREMQYLTESLHYSPNNAWALEEMGRFQMHRMHAATDPALAAAAVRSANAHFHRALMERPTTPFAWANLALSMLYMDQLDDELFAALRYADELGPWEPAVQQLVLFVGLTVWHRLGTPQQGAMVRTLERAMRRNAQQVTELVKRFNRFDLLCDIQGGNMKMERPCSRLQESEPRSIRPKRPKRT